MSLQTKKTYSFVYRNSLTIFFSLLFLVTLFAQALTGFNVHNQELKEAGAKILDFKTYLCSGHFISATFENFESEFLQMAMYVILTIKMRQIGSSESKKLCGKEPVDREPVARANAPWPVKKGGIILKIYENSLSICFMLLFVLSWCLHFYGSWQDYNVEQVLKKMPKEKLLDYLQNANFWFESFQNWQSEFLSIASIVFFTIFLRQKGSPESKPVDVPHLETGE